MKRVPLSEMWDRLNTAYEREVDPKMSGIPAALRPIDSGVWPILVEMKYTLLVDFHETEI